MNRLLKRGSLEEGVTLVEVLVTLSLFAVLGGLVFSLIWSGRALLERQSEWHQRARVLGPVLERLEGDLISAVTPETVSLPGFEISRKGANSLWRGYTAVARSESGNGGSEGYGIEAVEWRMESGTLLRESHAEAGERRGTEPVVDQWRELQGFRVEAWDPNQGAWKAEWRSERGMPPPPAVRVTLHDGTREWSRVVVIPTGFSAAP